MHRKTHFTSILLILFCTILTSSGQYFIKIGTTKLIDFNSIFNLNLMIGVVIYIVAAVLLIIALKKGELSVLYPFIALSFVWVFLISIFILKEIVLLTNWAGLVLIIIGVSFIGFGAEKHSEAIK